MNSHKQTHLKEREVERDKHKKNIEHLLAHLNGDRNKQVYVRKYHHNRI